jgi:hypothetical protein
MISLKEFLIVSGVTVECMVGIAIGVLLGEQAPRLCRVHDAKRSHGSHVDRTAGGRNCCALLHDKSA